MINMLCFLFIKGQTAWLGGIKCRRAKKALIHTLPWSNIHMDISILSEANPFHKSGVNEKLPDNRILSIKLLPSLTV
jgi:hypothetical protein